MGIKLKPFLPAIIVLLAALLFVHLYWLPEYKSSEAERRQAFQQASLEILKASLVKPVMDRDLIAIERVMRVYQGQDSRIVAITLRDKSKDPLYLFESDESSTLSVNTVNLIYSRPGIQEAKLDVVFSQEISSPYSFSPLEYGIAAALILAVFFSVFFQDRFTRRSIRKLAKTVGLLANNDHGFDLPLAPNKEMEALIRSIESLDRNVAIACNDLDKQIGDATRMEHELSSVNAKLDAIFNTISYGLIIANSKGIIDSVNPAMCSLSGYSEEELVGENVKLLMTGLLRERHDLVLEGYNGKSASDVIGRGPIEVKIISKEGASIPIDIALESVAIGDELYFVAVIHDIRERKTSEKSIKKERDKAKIYLDTVEVIILAIDMNGLVTLINRKGCQILGYKEEELLGKNWFDICIPEETRQQCKDTFWSLDRVKALDYKESLIITASGERKTIAWHYSVLWDDDGNMSGLLSSGADISDIKIKESERESIRSQLQQAQKMEAVGQLTGGIAHDFNNIIASIMGHTELVMTRLNYLDDEKVHKYLEHVYKSGERARDLVDKMLAFSRGQSGGAPSDIEVDSAIDDVIKMLRSIIPSTVSINSHYEYEAISALTTTIDLQQIIMNLCINARDAMNGTGEIDISVYGVNGVAGVCSSCHGNIHGDYVVISVKDTGPGISDEKKIKIFDPFFTTKAVGEGSGMGLSVVHGVTHDHGGHIELKSTVGAGSEFKIYLKRVGEEALEKTVALDTDIERNGVILVVDDEPLVGNFISEILEAQGHTVVAIDNPKRVLDIVKTNPHMVSMLITDFNMPGMDGIMLSEEIRALACDMPIIICTGYSDAIDSERSGAVGISAIVKKPMKGEELANLVETILTSHKVMSFPKISQQ